MAEENKAAAQAGTSGQPQQAENKSFFAKYGGSIIQMIFFWIVMKAISGGFGNNNGNQTPAPTAQTTQESVQSNYIPGKTTLRDYAYGIPNDVQYYPVPEIPLNDLPDSFAPLWPVKSPVELSIYVSEDEYFREYNKVPDVKTSVFSYGVDFTPQEYKIDIPTTSTIQHNGTVYAHIFVTQLQRPINPADPAFISDAVVYHRHVLTKFYPQRSIVKQKNLLKGKSGEEEEESVHVEEKIEEKIEEKVEEPVEDKKEGIIGLNLLGNLTRRAPLAAYWQQNFTLSLLTDSKNVLPKTALQPPVMKYIQFDEGLARNPTGNLGFYKPIVFPNEFWTLQQNGFAVNESVSVLPLNIIIEPISMWKFNIFATLDESMRQQANSPLGGMSSGDLDEVKRMFLETNPILLGTTIAVSLLHSLFEMLAFKNDIQFWKQKSNSAGISVRTLIYNIITQIIIFLFLMDNNQETSYMILISQGFGLLLEIWKVFKALKYELVWTPGSLLPKLGHQDVSQTEEEDETSKYDAVAYKYLTWLTYPLLGGYAIYSLYYDEHKSWYSYVLKTLVEFVYMFGFITMLPQLYINYKLKSVAHMPWKTLMYKSLNTFIDDLFAFVIKMPTLHRLACLRDDFVFFVYLYQRHAYKTDHTRANEYGQVGESSEKDAENEKKETKKNK